MRLLSLLAGFCIVFVCASVMRAAMGPIDKISYMCEHADAIVEGEAAETGSKFAIQKVYKTHPRCPKDLTDVVISDLTIRERTLWEGFKRTDLLIQTRKAVAFLYFNKEKNEWSTGPVGLIWYDREKCYRYSQISNPGSMHLYPVKSTVDEIRKEVEKGVAASKEWHAALEIANPEKKARALAKYILPRTSPVGTDNTFRFRVRTEMKEIGEPAIDPLIEMIKNRLPEDDLNEAALSFNDMGPVAERAVPVLIELLQNPGKTSEYYILSALKNIGDTRAIPAARNALKGKKSQALATAALFLAIMEDTQSLQAIEDSINASWTESSEYDLRDMLNSVWHLNPKRAEPLMKRAEADERFADLKDQLRHWREQPRKKVPKKPDEF